MAKLVAPDKHAIETSVQGARTGIDIVYRRQKDGTMHVDNPAHIKAMKSEGFFEANLGGRVTKGGFQCAKCNFQSYFKKCSRCGTEGEQL